MASIRVADAMLPALAADFGGEPSSMAPVITLFTLAYGVMQLVWGPLGDRLGKLRVIAWAALAATLGSAACAVAPSLAWLSAARLATGACCAAIIPLAIAHVGDSVAYEVRQATLARLATGTLTGLVAGQVLGGTMADTLGWRTAFGVLAVVFLATGWAVLRLHRRLADRPRPVPTSGVPAALAALYGWRLVLGDGWSRRVLVGALAEGALMFGVLAFVPSWLHERTGMSLAAAGAAVGAVGVGGLLYATSARRFIARLGERGLLAAGGATVCAGFVVLAAFARGPADATTWLVALAGCGLAGFGFYMLHNTMQTLATQLAPQARATAVGLFAVAIFAGQSIGVATVARIGPTLGFATTFVACGAALAALGIALGAMVSRRAGRVGR